MPCGQVLCCIQLFWPPWGPWARFVILSDCSGPPVRPCMIVGSGSCCPTLLWIPWNRTLLACILCGWFLLLSMCFPNAPSPSSFVSILSQFRSDFFWEAFPGNLRLLLSFPTTCLGSAVFFCLSPLPGYFLKLGLVSACHCTLHLVDIKHVEEVDG
jgi:hypothetical protein